MNQSSALRQLEIIIEEAMTSNENNQTGLILMRAMQLQEKPCNLVSFFAILHKAKEEAKRLKYPKVDRDIAALEDLQKIFSENHAWGHPWSVFSGYINVSNILSILNNLANSYHSQTKNLFLEKEFLEELDNDFSCLLQEILDSELPKTLKNEIKIKIEDILSCIHNYSINGTEGIEKAVQSLLVRVEIGDKNSNEVIYDPILKKLKITAIGLLLFLKPSFWDVAGLLPDVDSFWTPKFHELVEFRQKIEPQIDEDTTIKNICEKLSQAKETKLLTGTSPNSLLPSKED